MYCTANKNQAGISDDFGNILSLNCKFSSMNETGGLHNGMIHTAVF
jgi:hypothetical protein